ncbi:hypothetical protein HYFRA_00009239 [Hymenoscyphus fraxineus]|uniref:Amino acid permease/ SLC12A domain-containing protein n=1 Tax=Hymenoscyphus fraxineus TaxID=746836 RepID=A0A9N9KXW9_9HELO|nr:hypothetical protein HYFRA_00009239 [Hymenoscyphus fraxineus]
MEQPNSQRAATSQHVSKDVMVDTVDSPVIKSDDVEDNTLTSSKQHGEYKRQLTSRHVHLTRRKIISLGSNIGSGIFIATGKALHQGGPGNIILGYALVCSLITAVLATIAEITIAFPTSGNFIDYANRFVDPSMAFAAGFAEWLGWTGVVAAEATVFNIVVQYWAHDSIHKVVWLSVFIFCVSIIFLLPVRWFAWFEYICSLLKIFSFILVIVASICVLAGAGPTAHVHGSETWGSFPIFANGFRGFLNAVLLSIWATGDQVFTGIMAGEAVSPRYSMAHAVKLVPARVTLIYMTGAILISFLVSGNDPRLLGGNSTTSSPFVIAMNDAGIKGVPDIINIAIIISTASLAAEGIYTASRVLRALAHAGLIHKSIAKVDSKGRPRYAIAITVLAAVTLTYINLSNTGVQVFTWLVSIVSSSFFCVWFVIAIISFRFRAALRAQNDPLFTEIHAYKTSWWPFPPTYLFVGSIFPLIGCIYIGILPLVSLLPSETKLKEIGYADEEQDSKSINVYNFFQYMLGLFLIATSYLGYKCVFRTKIVDPKKADLVTGRRTLDEKEIEMLDEYYAMPIWRRFFCYIQLW